MFVTPAAVAQYLMDKAEPLPQMMTGLGLLAQDAQMKGEEGVNRLFAGVYALATQEELDLEALVRERAAHVFPRDVHHDSLS